MRRDRERGSDCAHAKRGDRGLGLERTQVDLRIEHEATGLAAMLAQRPESRRDRLPERAARPIQVYGW